MEHSRISPDLEGLKALAHPTRMRMLTLLRLDGPATATTLARRLDLNTGATSYHLRHLARSGFVVEDTERGNARDRWWKAAHTSTWSEDSHFTDHAGREAFDAMLQAAAVNQTLSLQAAMEERPLLSDAWRHASTVSEWTHRLTPERARELVDRITAVFDDFEDMDDPEAVHFKIQYAGFPVPGRLEPDTDPDAER